jgi:hypothetical protein
MRCGITEVEMAEYVSYNIEKYYRIEPTGPIRCSMCSNRLSKSAIEPSKHMSKEVIADPDHVYCDYGSSHLFTCNMCDWWCIREHYEFVVPSVTHRYGFDYLIVSTAKNAPKVFRTTAGEKSQPWLEALDDSMVYHKVQDLPENLAAIFEGGMTWKEYKSDQKLT